MKQDGVWLLKLEKPAQWWYRSCEELLRTLVLHSRNFYLLRVKWASCFCRWKALNLDRMQSWEPSDLRGFFLFGPTPVMSSSLPGLLFLSAVALCSPCESRCQKRLMGHSIASLVFLFLPSQWLPPFLFSPCLSWPVWGYLRLTITTTMHKAFSHQLEDFPWFLHLTCSQEWSDLGLMSVFCSVPCLSHFGKAELQMQMGSCKLELIRKVVFIPSLTAGWTWTAWLCADTDPHNFAPF